MTSVERQWQESNIQVNISMEDFIDVAPKLIKNDKAAGQTGCKYHLSSQQY